MTANSLLIFHYSSSVAPSYTNTNAPRSRSVPCPASSLASLSHKPLAHLTLRPPRRPQLRSLFLGTKQRRHVRGRDHDRTSTDRGSSVPTPDHLNAFHERTVQFCQKVPPVGKPFTGTHFPSLSLDSGLKQYPVTPNNKRLPYWRFPEKDA